VEASEVGCSNLFFGCGQLVQPAKIFEIREKADLGLIVWKLKDFREEERYQTEKGETIDLVTEILDGARHHFLPSNIHPP